MTTLISQEKSLIKCVEAVLILTISVTLNFNTEIFKILFNHSAQFFSDTNLPYPIQCLLLNCQ